jgi:hypothetical protein
MNTWETISPTELASAFDIEHNALNSHNTQSERAV